MQTNITTKKVLETEGKKREVNQISKGKERKTVELNEKDWKQQKGMIARPITEKL